MLIVGPLWLLEQTRMYLECIALSHRQAVDVLCCII